MTGAERIAAERRRQVEVENWTPEHDRQHRDGELSCAGYLYAMIASAQCRWANDLINFDPPGAWPWDAGWWKPSADPIRNLEKAGALIAAEIDRLTEEVNGVSGYQKREETNAQVSAVAQGNE
jgi:hypothetical protein